MSTLLCSLGFISSTEGRVLLLYIEHSSDTRNGEKYEVAGLYIHKPTMDISATSKFEAKQIGNGGELDLLPDWVHQVSC